MASDVGMDMGVGMDRQTVAVARVARRTVIVLSCSQVLGGVGLASGLAVGSLLARDVGGTDAVAGLALTATVVGAALFAVPISRIMSRSGRRPGLVIGYAAAAGGGLVTATGALVDSLALVLIGMFVFGAGTASNLQARYAAADLATPDRRGRSLALVVWATTIGAVLGPNLAGPTGRRADDLGLPVLAGPFLFAAVIFGVGGLVVWLLLRPDPLLLARDIAVRAGEQVHVGRQSVRSSLSAVTASPDGRLGLLAVVVSHAVMVSVMVLTPVHLDHGGATLTVIGVVISLHIAGMYGFSPLVGWLADRISRRRTILLGAGLLLSAVTVAGTAAPSSSVQLGVGLVLLGMGWSCGLIAGSTLLVDAVPVAIRPGAQGATDLVMGLGAGVAGAVAGPVVALAGYGALTLGAGLLVLPLAVVAVRRGAALVVPA